MLEKISTKAPLSLQEKVSSCIIGSVFIRDIYIFPFIFFLNSSFLDESTDKNGLRGVSALVIQGSKWKSRLRTKTASKCGCNFYLEISNIDKVLSLIFVS